MKHPHYFDLNSTSPLCDSASKALMQNLDYFYNPSSLHQKSWMGKLVLQDARKKVAGLIGTHDENVFFTSSGTEANNWAMKGFLFQKKYLTQKTKPHVIISSLEHSSILEVARFFEKEFDFAITYLKPNSRGLITTESVAQSLTPLTCFVSIMHGNNETGALMPIQEIAQVLNPHNIHFHVDGVQTTGKLPLNIEDLNLSSFSFSAHKFHGPKGVGGLWLKNKSLIPPLLHGGGQEFGMRGGTENVALIAATGEAASEASQNLNHKSDYMRALTSQLKKDIQNSLPSTKFNTPDTEIESLPHVLNFTLPGVSAKSLCALLDLKYNVQISTQAACSNNKKSNSISHVLESMGMTKSEAESTVRVSLAHYHTTDDLQYFVKALIESVGALIKISPQEYL